MVVGKALAIPPENSRVPKGVPGPLTVLGFLAFLKPRVWGMSTAECCCVTHPTRICTDELCSVVHPDRICTAEFCCCNSQVSYGGKSLPELRYPTYGTIVNAAAVVKIIDENFENYIVSSLGAALK